MPRHVASVHWERGDAAFTDGRYPRAHRWSFDGGLEVPASASPHVVKEPLSDPAAVDPEESFVAALASCHMLWFLSLAAGRGWVVDRYQDDAEGRLGKDDRGRISITRVTLRPQATYSGPTPDPATERALHEEAHQACFLANSVRSEIDIEL